MPRKQPKSQTVTSGTSSVRAGDRLFAALTHEEITQLLDGCFVVMPPDLQARVLQQLQPDTRQTVEQVLDPSQADSGGRPTAGAPVSSAKLAQAWSTAWKKWHRIIDAAGNTDGGVLFMLACGVWLASAVLIFQDRTHLLPAQRTLAAQ